MCPADRRLSAFLLTIIPTINAITADENPGMKSLSPSVTLGRNLCANSPAPIGNITTHTIESSIPTASTSTYCPAKSHVSAGVSMGAAMVLTVVMPTLSARSPPARKVMTFEAVPPGQHPTSTTPTARSAGSDNAFVSSHASPGITMNCAAQPVSTSLGLVNTTLKSSALSDIPMPNITTPSNGLTAPIPKDPNAPGHVIPTTAARSTHTPIHREMNAKTLFTLSIPANLDNTLFGYNVLRPIDVKANYGNKVKKGLIRRRMPNGSQFLTHFLIGLRNAIAHPSNTAKAGVSAINRKLPFLRGESGTYVKDLSDSRIARIMPGTKGVKSILGNMFIEQDNANTIRPAYEFMRASRSTPMGDRRIPLSNFKLFIGVVGGKLKVDSLNHFSDSDVVTPVVNKTELALSLKRQSAAAVVDYAKRERMWCQNPPAGVPAAAVADSVAKYNNLSSSEVGFVNGRGLFIPSTSLKRDKSLLVSPNGNSMFINNMGNLSPRQDSLVNDFLRRNGGAYPVQLDNGRYSHFLEGDCTTYDKYMSSDLYRAPESVWAFGEVE